MIDHNHVRHWLDDYIQAWKSYDPAAIGALFSEDAGYRYNPFDERLRGRETIVANWLQNKDAPNTFSASYTPIAITDNTAVAQGRTQYYESDGKTPRTQFDNIFVLQFDDDGLCKDFCEWFMQPR